MQQQLFSMLLESEEVTWKTLLYDLVESKKMDPWDINITLLTQEYLAAIKKMQKHDLRISGKILLAAAIMLKIKSTYLIDNDLSNLGRLMNQNEEELEEELLNVDENYPKEKQKFQLIPKNPQPRNRKVSIYDLVEALQQALASKRRILAKYRPAHFVLPKAKVDIMGIIRDIYHKIAYYSSKDDQPLSFTKLLPPRAGKREKVYTFVPLLHLENEQKILTEQKKPFDE